MRTLVARPLTVEAYRPFGDVIAARSTTRAANQGSAQKSEHLAALDNLRAGARPNLSVFRCAPRGPFPFTIALLEKHPASTQVFVPMNAQRYLVVVAGGDAEPDLETLEAFVATGTQGITYRPGVWHHPMIALDAETDFACLVFEDGSAGDCTEWPVPVEQRVAVSLPQ